MATARARRRGIISYGTLALVLGLSGCIRLGYDLSSLDPDAAATSPDANGAGNAGALGSGGAAGASFGGAAGSSFGVSGSPSALVDLCDALTHYGYWIVSNSQGESTPALYAVDGNLDTIYQSAAQQNEPNHFFLQLDFHGRVSLDGLTLAYPSYLLDYPRGYEIYVSDAADPAATDRVAAGATTPPSTGEPYVRVDFPTATGRYLRIVQTGTATFWWTVPELTLSNCRTVSVSSTPAGGSDIYDRSAWRVRTSSLANPLPMLDGNPDSYWQLGAAPRDGFWVEVDLSAVGTVNGLVMTHKPGDAPMALRISTSVDGLAFTPVGPDVTGADTMSVPFSSQARFVRLVHVGTRDTTWWSIAELDLLR